MKSRRIVVDADVARACSEAEHAGTRAWRCLQPLHLARDICHTVVMTGALKSEWDDHRSTSFNDWLDSMFARRKVRRLAVPPDETLRGRVRRASASPEDWQAAEKDMHVIEAALAADRIVLSCDRRARDRFTRMAADVGELRDLVWANPDLVEPNEIEAWLIAGARPRKALMLGGSGQ